MRWARRSTSGPLNNKLARQAKEADTQILERFVRDRRGRIVGIVYTLGDSEVEAKRVQ
jgi:hypothetical protein